MLESLSLSYRQGSDAPLKARWVSPTAALKAKESAAPDPSGAVACATGYMPTSTSQVAASAHCWAWALSVAVRSCSALSTSSKA
jgi:hypothetical protein